MSDNFTPAAEEKPTKRGGALEGMDPITGDYIRPQQQQQQQNNNKQKSFVDCFTIEVPMPPDAPNSDTKTTDGGSSERRELQRKWSRRIVHTLSNRSRDADDEGEQDGADNCLFGRQIRFTIMAICTLCLSSILSNILTFNFTYICMAGEKPTNFSNMTDPSEWVRLGYSPHLDYSSEARSALFMVVAVGSLLTVFPLTILLNKFGSRLVFGCLGFISAFATVLVLQILFKRIKLFYFLIPLAANVGFPFMLIMRLVQGAAFSACLPVMGSITSHWSTLKQNGIFIAILSSFFQIAPIFTMPISGELCTSSLGWPSVYYLHGIVTLILFTVFMLYHRNTPSKHPMMSRTEIVKVMFNKGASIYSGPTTDGKKPTKKKSRQVPPYWAMYLDKSIWAILVASFGNFMGTQLSLQFMPTYINKVLHMPIEQTGMASAISPTIMFFIKLFAGQSSDRIKFISDGRKLRIYNTLSLGMMGLLFIVLALLDPNRMPTFCLVILIASTCILGFNSGGFFKSSQMVSRQHSHFTLANISFLNCVCMLIVPLLNEIIAPENESENWAIVLWIHGIILLLTNAFFCAFASAKPAKWTMDNFKDTKKGWKRNKIGVKNENFTDSPKIVTVGTKEAIVY